MSDCRIASWSSTDHFWMYVSQKSLKEAERSVRMSGVVWSLIGLHPMGDGETSWGLDQFVSGIVSVVGRHECLDFLNLGCIKLLCCKEISTVWGGRYSHEQISNNAVIDPSRGWSSKVIRGCTQDYLDVIQEVDDRQEKERLDPLLGCDKKDACKF